MEKLRHGSLFSGIGGFDLAAEWMGWENVFHCEWNEFGQKVLKHYWPNAESFSDITKTDFTKYYGTVDIITGGFPCQPYSSAGKRKGKEDERHLWPEMCRAIREVSPRFVVGENVRGLTNWNGGMVFDEVCAELESYGYQVAPVIIPACGVGAPHRRERIWFVAHAENSGYRRGLCEQCRTREWQLLSEKQRGDQMGCKVEGCSREWITTNANSRGLEGTKEIGWDSVNVEWKSDFGTSTNATGFGFCGNGTAEQSQPETFRTWDRMGAKNVTNAYSLGSSREWKLRESREKRQRANERSSKLGYNKHQWEKFPTESPICGGNDGFSSQLDGITFPKWRNESIKAYGNAIVPQVAFEIFKALEKSLYL